MSSRRHAVLDAVLAASLCAWGQAEVWGSGAEMLVGPKWANAAVYAIMSLFLLGRRQVPVWTLTAQCAVLSVLVVAYGSSETLAWVLPLTAGVYAVAAYRATRRILGATMPVLLCLGTMSVADAAHRVQADVLGALPFLGLLAGAWLLGEYARTRRLYFNQLTVSAEWAARERERLVREGAAEQRTRIARELHDVLAHGMTVMVRQVEAGQARLATDPEKARASFDAVAEAGRRSLDEVRRLVYLLRENETAEGQKEPRATSNPAPHIDEVGLLAAHVSRTGLAVDVRGLNDVSGVPAGLGLALYRIVQEALTNSMRHGHARSATVTLGREGGAVVAEILDDGVGPGGPIVTGSGLTGMHERAALYGGTVKVDAGEAGGVVVRAVLPLTEPA